MYFEMIYFQSIIEKMVDRVWVIYKDNEVKKTFDSSQKAQKYIAQKKWCCIFFNPNGSRVIKNTNDIHKLQ